MALATLSIDIVAQLGRFEADMRRAAGVAEQAASRIERGFGGIGTVFAGSFLSGAALQAVQNLARALPRLIDGVAIFQDLEEKTGASAEALASFQTAADVSGTSVDQLAGFMVKLTGTLSKTNDETKGAGAALKALGLDLESFRNLAPEEQFKTIAERLNTFRDGAGKTAIAIALLGKSGADALPFFKELAQSGLAQNRLTAEQIRLADDLADRNAKLRSELKQAAQVAALQALPAFNALVEQLVKATSAVIDIDGAAKKLGTNSGIQAFAEDAALGLATVADAAVFANRAIGLIIAGVQTANANLRLGQQFLSDPRANAQFIKEGTGPLKEALDARNAAVAESDKRLRQLLSGDDFAITNGLKQQFATAKIAQQAGIDDLDRLLVQAEKSGKPELKFNAPDVAKQRDADQLRKAILESSLRQLEAIFASEREAVQFQRQFLDAEYQRGLVSIGDYYSQRRALDERALGIQLEGFKKEADALRQSLTAPDLSAADRERLQQRIRDTESKAALERQKFSQDSRLSAQQEEEAYQRAADRIIEFRAQVLELQGDLARAAELRAGLAIEQARRSSVGLGLPAADVEKFAAVTRQVDSFTAAQREAQRVANDAGIAEERFLIAARRSGAGRAEIESGLTAIRQRALEQLGQLVLKAEESAKGLGPDSPAVQGAQQLRLEYERAAANVDLLRLRLEEFADRTAGQIAGSITDAIINGDWVFAGRRIGEDLVRGILEEEFTKPLQDALSKLLRDAIQPGSKSVLDGVFRAFGADPKGPPLGANPDAGPVAAAVEPLKTAIARVVPGLDGLAQSALGASAFAANTSLITLGAAAELAAQALLSVAASSAGQGFSSGIGFLNDLGGLELLGSLGFDSGGYTGNAPVTAPAGVVHGQEYVFSAPAVRAIGVGNLDRAHRQARAGAPSLGLPGYADGGFVRGGMNITFAPQFVISGPVDRRTLDQIRAESAMGMQDAIERRTAGAT